MRNNFRFQKASRCALVTSCDGCWRISFAKDTNEILCAMDFGEFAITVVILNYGAVPLVTN